MIRRRVQGAVLTLAYLQVLVRRELEEAAKVLGERIRTNDASPEVLLLLRILVGSRWFRSVSASSGHCRPSSLQSMANSVA